MDPATIVNVILCILSFILATISVVTVLITIRQNNKMLEESTRPVITIYTQSINLGLPLTYLIIKNCGNSPAYMKKLNADVDFSGCYKINSSKNYIDEFSRCNFAPGQSRYCILDLNKIQNTVNFTVEYSSQTKTYKETFEIDLSAASGMPYSRSETPGKELFQISIALQEMLLRNL